MPDVVDQLAIINEARARFGGRPIMALDEETAAAGVAARIYPTLYLRAMEAHRWTWSRSTTQLSRLAVTVETGWRYAYELPGNRLSAPVRVMTNPRYPDYPLREFAIFGDELHADAESVWATCAVAVTPDRWPGLFRNAFVVALAGDLCVPEAHDVNLAAAFRQEAWGTAQEGGRGGLFGLAIARDAASSPGLAPLGAADPLTDAWHGGF